MMESASPESLPLGPATPLPAQEHQWHPIPSLSQRPPRGARSVSRPPTAETRERRLALDLPRISLARLAPHQELRSYAGLRNYSPIPLKLAVSYVSVGATEGRIVAEVLRPHEDAALARLPPGSFHDLPAHVGLRSRHIPKSAKARCPAALAAGRGSALTLRLKWPCRRP